MYVIPAMKQGSLETAFIIPSAVLIPDNLQSWIEQEAGMDAKTLKTWMSDFMPTAWCLATVGGFPNYPGG